MPNNPPVITPIKPEDIPYIKTPIPGFPGGLDKGLPPSHPWAVPPPGGGINTNNLLIYGGLALIVLLLLTKK